MASAEWPTPPVMMKFACTLYPTFMFDPSSIKVVFFDIGNVFVSDDPSGCFAYRCLYERLHADGHQMPIDEFFRLRTEHVRQGGGLWTFVRQYVSEEQFKDWQRAVRRRMYDQWSHLSPAIASMHKVPAQLEPHYRLGIIANQPPEVEHVLEERGLLRHFEIRAISDALNLHKPDPALFEWAIDAAGVQPHETLMVGDRIDNDIRPAKSVGMKTAWLRLGYDNREWLPQDDFQTHYAASIAQVSYSEAEPEAEVDRPDITVRSADELLGALLQVNA